MIEGLRYKRSAFYFCLSPLLKRRGLQNRIILQIKTCVFTAANFLMARYSFFTAGCNDKLKENCSFTLEIAVLL